VSLVVRRGEAVGLFGPKRSGKSTALGVLAGVLRPDAGDVWICEQPDPTRADVRRRIGWIPQRLALYPDLTVEENLLFFGKLNAISEALLRERLLWALELTELQERRKSKAKTLSGGVLRRLNLACGIVHGPELLLLDEPMHGVDPTSRQLLRNALDALRAEGMSMVLATRHPSEVETFCSRIAIIDTGRLLDEGTLEELVQRHAPEQQLEADLTEQSLSRVLLSQVQLPAGISLRDNRLHARTSNPLQMAAELHRVGIQIRSLMVRRPGLDEVFQTLSGRTLRDDVDADALSRPLYFGEVR